MTHRQHFNFYIASCHYDGGILFCEFSEGRAKILEKINLDRPMYMVFDVGNINVLLRDPHNKNESGLLTLTLRNGKLEKKGEVISTMGNVACHLCIFDSSVYCVNYLSGNVVKIPDRVVLHRGCGTDEKRQDMPHTHYINSFDGKYLLCCDLGTDEVYTYDRELNEISRVKVPDGHGPRHLEFYEGMIYCLNELKSTLSVFDYNDGKLVLKETVSVLPEGYDVESYSAAIRIKDGLIYTSNRGHDSISVLKPEGYGARLITTVSCGGAHPRDFNIFGNILVCVNEKSDNVTFFEFANGIPQKLNFELKIKSPICVI